MKKKSPSSKPGTGGKSGKATGTKPGGDGKSAAGMEVDERKKAAEGLSASEELFRSLYDTMLNGVALHELIFDNKGKPVDYWILDVNPSFEKILSLSKGDIVGKPASKAYGAKEAPYLNIYAPVAQGGEPSTFETYFPPMEKHFRISVFSHAPDRFATVFEDITKMKTAENRIIFLNRILRSIRNVNQLIIKEKDKERLLQSSCELLVESGGYSTCWLMHTDEAGGFLSLSYAGFGMEIKALTKRLKKGDYVQCARRVRGKDERIVTPYQNAECGDCPLCEIEYHGPSLSIDLRHEGRSYGVLTVSLPEGGLVDDEERSLFTEVAGDISFALYGIDREEEVRKQTILANEFLDALPAIALILKKGSHETMASNKHAEAAGAVPGKTCFDALGSPGKYHEWCLAPKMWETGEKQEIVVEFQGIVWEMHWIPLDDDTFLHIVFDITEKKKAEKEIERYTRLLQETQKLSGVGGWEYDVKTGKNSWTDEVYSIYGVPEDFDIDDLEKTAGFFAGGDRDSVLAAFRRCVEEGEPYDMEVRFVNALGRELWVRSLGEPVVEDGKVVKVRGNFVDITEARAAVEAVRKSEKKFRLFFENTPEYCYLVTPDTRIVDINTAALERLRYTKDEIIGQPISTIYAPEFHPKMRELYKTWRKTGKINNEDMDIITKDGERCHVLLSADAFRDEEGNILHSISTQRDITELKRAQMEKEKFSKAIEMSNEGVVILGLDIEVADVNDAMVNMLGYTSRDEMLGMNGLEMLASGQQDKAQANLLEVLSGDSLENLEYTLNKKNGKEIMMEVGVTTMKDQAGEPTGIVIICRDITERKRRELEMRRALMSFDVSEGNLYLVKEDTPSISLGAIRDLIKVGYKARALSRTPRTEFPEDILASSEHLWISETGDEGCIRPAIADMEAWAEGLPRKQVIFIDRLDFIYSRNGARHTIGFIQRLRDLAHIKDHTVILSMDPATLDEKELRMLEKETRELVPVHRTKLPEDLFDVLKYVYNENLSGRDPSHTDICAELDLSKPTVRKRLKELLFSGHVKESVKGSKKVLSVTEKGRRPFLKQ